MLELIPDALLDDRSAFVGMSGSGKTYASGVWVERLLQLKRRVVISDPLDVWWGLRLLKDGKTPSGYDVVIFGGKHADLPLTPTSGRLIGETVATMKESAIVALDLLPSAGARRRFMLDFLEAIYEATNPAKVDPYHLVFDEADLWAPQKPVEHDHKMLQSLIEQIVRRGRVKGFIPWLITQRPAVLSKDVLSQADTLIAMKLVASQDRNAIKAWIEGQADMEQARQILGSLPGLAVGQGVLWAPGHGILETVNFPWKQTFDSSRTPKRGERRKQTSIAPLDLSALQEKMAAVDIEAKENDPKILKAKIAELQLTIASNEKAKSNASSSFYVAAAEARGRERGYDQGYREGRDYGGRHAAHTQMLRVMDGLRSAPMLNGDLDVMKAAFDQMREIKVEESPTARVRLPVPEDVPLSSRTETRPAPSPDPAVAVRDIPKASADVGQFTKSETKVLRALMLWRSLGNETPTKIMVAGAAGYSPGSGGFNNILGKLRSAGVIEYPQPGCVRLIASGIDSMTKDEARDALFSIMNNPQRKLFDALIAGGMSKQELGAATGYSHGSGGFNNLLGRLRSLSIIDYPRPGQVALEPWVHQIL